VLYLLVTVKPVSGVVLGASHANPIQPASVESFMTVSGLLSLAPRSGNGALSDRDICLSVSVASADMSVCKTKCIVPLGQHDKLLALAIVCSSTAYKAPPERTEAAIARPPTDIAGRR